MNGQWSSLGWTFLQVVVLAILVGSGVGLMFHRGAEFAVGAWCLTLALRMVVRNA